jgi:hypothetical protein
LAGDDANLINHIARLEPESLDLPINREQGVEPIVTRELLGHAHIGVTATVYAHVRLRLQRDAIDLLGRTLGKPSETTTNPDDSDDPPLCAAPVR